jgi:hypothetical protein
MTSVAPSKPWADGPLKLVATPQFQTKKVGSLGPRIHGRQTRMLIFRLAQTDIFTSGATHMALLRTSSAPTALIRRALSLQPVPSSP